MEIKNLSFSFNSKSQVPLLFNDLNLRIEPNEITVLLGPSGSGKSTLLRIFSELQTTKDDKTILEKDLKTESFIFQEATLLEWLTGYKNIMLPIKLSKQKIELTYYDQLIHILKINEILDLYPHQLSGGQKMRISIARALITQPKVLFMDEPFSSLDEPTRLDLQDELLSIQSRFKMTILFVTHSFYEAAYLANRIVILNQEKPAKIIFDQVQKRDFKTRFDESYQKKVQEITGVFKKGLVAV